MDQHPNEEAAAIEEMEIATKQLKLAYLAVLNKSARMAKNVGLKINPTMEELDELDIARDRFDKARGEMDRIAEEIRKGLRG